MIDSKSRAVHIASQFELDFVPLYVPPTMKTTFRVAIAREITRAETRGIVRGLVWATILFGGLAVSYTLAVLGL